MTDDCVTLIGGPFHGRVLCANLDVYRIPTGAAFHDDAEYVSRDFGAVHGSIQLRGHAMVWSSLSEEDGWKLALRTFADKLCGEKPEAV